VRAFVTGGAGFIGSHVVDRLLADGATVTIYDNLSTGFREFLDDARLRPGFTLIEGDLLDTERLKRALPGHDVVFHFAANADVRFGLDQPRQDLEQNTIGTFNVLDAMRSAEVRRIVFSSTGSVYGEPHVFPTPETAPFPIQTSLYGASKVAAEGLITAHCEGFGFQAWIFRFVSILGERYTHGHVFDFVKALLADPHHLPILGDGRQRKSYLHVGDCVEAILTALAGADGRVNVFNLGTEEYCTVDDSAGWICEHLGVKPERQYSGGRRGWIGDSPFIFLDCSRIQTLGWKPKLSIRDGILRTVDFLMSHRWLLERAARR